MMLVSLAPAQQYYNGVWGTITSKYLSSIHWLYSSVKIGRVDTRIYSNTALVRSDKFIHMHEVAYQSTMNIFDL